MKSDLEKEAKKVQKRNLLLTSLAMLELEFVVI
jgi:hypothetical protein